MHKYRTSRKISEGSYGRVVEAVTLRDNARVAIKQIKVDVNANEGVPGVVYREVSILKKVAHHDSFVRLLEAFTEDHQIYMVFDYCPDTLDSYLKQQPRRLDLDTSRAVIRQILKGLEFLHRQGIAHRDIKPENILMDALRPTTSVRIGDLGMAREILDDGELRTAAVMTPCFRAPEVCLGCRLYGTPVDIWSCGVILVWIATGQHPFLESVHTVMPPRSDGRTGPREANHNRFTEMGYLMSIFRCLGTPTEEEWPDMRHLPLYVAMTPEFKASNKFLRDFPGRELALNMLHPNPAKRASAHETLVHPFLIDRTAAV
jgi:serine/threonine protein kinase